MQPSSPACNDPIKNEFNSEQVQPKFESFQCVILLDYIYKLVLLESTNSQNEESKRVLHGLCSPPTCKTTLHRLFRFRCCRYVMKGEMFIGRPPLCGERRYPRGGRSSPRGSLVCPAVFRNRVELDTRLK